MSDIIQPIFRVAELSIIVAPVTRCHNVTMPMTSSPPNKNVNNPLGSRKG